MESSKENIGGWRYTAQLGGRHDTRHEAIGAAAIAAREQLEFRGEGYGPTPIEATARVYAYKPFLCDYCGETFLSWQDWNSHSPCPQWVEEGQPGAES